MAHYHEESFGATPDEVKTDVVEQIELAQEESDSLASADMVQVEFSESGKSVSIAPGETVHTAAAKLGLYIPKACGMGICGTCKVRKVAGDVTMEQNGGISEGDIAEGYILSCCSIPTANTVIAYRDWLTPACFNGPQNIKMPAQGRHGQQQASSSQPLQDALAAAASAFLMRVSVAGWLENSPPPLPACFCSFCWARAAA
uniref:Oxidoreductase n=1 Tax=Oceanimonas doudoroffii TaxID=84158 RepID=G5CZF2_9GAMM|nr:oxidoreductase [Oceanimonas doudoroffii]